MCLFAFQIDEKGTYICIFWCTYNKDNKCRGTEFEVINEEGESVKAG